MTFIRSPAYRCLQNRAMRPSSFSPSFSDQNSLHFLIKTKDSEKTDWKTLLRSFVRSFDTKRTRTLGFLIRERSVKRRKAARLRTDEKNGHRTSERLRSHPGPFHSFLLQYRSRDLKCSKAEIDQISKGNFFCFFFFAFVICEIVFVPRRTSRSFCLPAQSFLAISFEEN